MNKVKKFFKDFKAFISRGNIIDMAVGVIIGGAFSTIVNAVVNSILMPVITAAIPGGLDGFVTVLNPNEALATSETANTISYWGVTYNRDIVNVVNWGTLINAIINFLIIAFFLFIVLKIAMNARSTYASAKELNNALTKEEKKALKAEGKSRKEIKQVAIDKIKAQKQEKERKEAEAKAVTEVSLLKDIKELLEKQQNSK